MAHVFSSPWRTVAAVAAMSVSLLLAGDSGRVAGESTAVAVEESPPAPAAHDTAVANRLLQGVAFAVLYSTLGIPIARWADRGVRRSIIALAIF